MIVTYGKFIRQWLSLWYWRPLIWYWYCEVSLTSHLLTIAFLFLLKSVYALYHGNTVMRRIVPSLFLIEIVGMVVGLTMSLPKITYNDLCLVTNAPRTLIIYAYAFSSIPTHTDRWSFFQGCSHSFPSNVVHGHHIQVHSCCTRRMGGCSTYCIANSWWNLGVLSAVLCVFFPP